MRPLIYSECYFSVVSSHHLNIEVGRQGSNRVERRLCLLCDKHDVEDEYHLVLICHIYSHYDILFSKDQAFISLLN